jgi:RNA-directed DNA polymerase
VQRRQKPGKDIALEGRLETENKGDASSTLTASSKEEAILSAGWFFVKAEILESKYHPAPIRQVKIAKPDGGQRTLSIPTVMDRLIQQGIAQVLSQVYDRDFSPSSYGYRPGRGAWKVLRDSQHHINAG